MIDEEMNRRSSASFLCAHGRLGGGEVLVLKLPRQARGCGGRGRTGDKLYQIVDKLHFNTHFKSMDYSMMETTY